MAATTNYKLQTLVKDASVGAALRKALADDGKLSYDEVLAIIYSTCDGNKITAAEVRDILAILENAKSIRNDPKINDLKERFRANPQSFLKYRDFTPQQLLRIIADVQEAARLSQKCMNALAATPSPKSELVSLLRRTFDVSLDDRNAIHSIQERFTRCWRAIDGADFQVSAQMDPHHFAETSHDGGAKKLVYISRQYFNAPPLFCHAALIHEMIHHFNGRRSDAHPGGIKPSGKLPLGIPFQQAVLNPYCYQWFAIYLVQPNFVNTITFETETVIRAK